MGVEEWWLVEENPLGEWPVELRARPESLDREPPRDLTGMG